MSARSAASCNCLALRQAMRHVTQFYDDAIARSGLRSTQYSLLNRIALHGTLTMNELARELVMDRTTLTHNLRPLQKGGYVALEVGRDRRERCVTLTPEGVRIHRRARELWNRANDRFDDRMGHADAKALRDVLHLVAHRDFGSIDGSS